VEDIDLITIGIALWGAGLSTILAIREFTKDRRKVKVYCYKGSIALPQQEGSRFMFVGVDITNTGHRPITIVGVGFELENGIIYTEIRDSVQISLLPKRLEDGDTFKQIFDYEKLKKASHEFREQGHRFVCVSVRDAEGWIHKGDLPDDMELFGTDSNLN